MTFSGLEEFVEDAMERMKGGDQSFQTLDITNPIAENHLEGSASRFAHDIDETLTTATVIQLLETARIEGKYVNDLFLGFFQIDHEVSLSLVKLFSDEFRQWKRLAIQQCPGRVLESCIALIASKGNLESLCLYLNDLGYTGFSSLAMVLTTNPSNLKVLDLEDFISFNSANALAAGLLVNTTLQTLDLHDCRFDGNSLETLMKGIADHSSLRHILLARCQLSDSNGALVVNKLMKSTSIQRIDLGYNFCNKRTFDAIAVALQDNRMPKLSALSLIGQSTSIDPRLVSSLPVGNLCKALKSNSMLKTLSLSCNNLDTDQLKNLMYGAKHSCLETLNLGCCGISDQGLENVVLHLPCTAKELDLSENLFASEASQEKLLQMIEGVNKIQSINIDQDLECYEELCYRSRLNIGGRRFLSSDMKVPQGLWSFILERINRIDWTIYNSEATKLGHQEDVLYFFLKRPPLCERNDIPEMESS